MLDTFARLPDLPCFPPIRVFVIGFGAVFIVMLLGDLYSRRTSDPAERRRRFLGIAAAAIVLSVAPLFFLFEEVCASGETCGRELDVRCDGWSPRIYAFSSALLPLLSMGIASGELIRRIAGRS